MPTYVVLSRLTTAGRRTLHREPQRLFEVNREVRALGCRVVEQLALLGAWDFLTLLDAPDNATAAQLALELGSRGTLQLMTLPAIALADLTRALSAEDQLGRPLAGPIVSTRPA